MYPPYRSLGRGRSVPRRTPRTSSRHRSRLKAPAALKPLVHVLNVVRGRMDAPPHRPTSNRDCWITKAVSDERRAASVSNSGSVTPPALRRQQVFRVHRGIREGQRGFLDDLIGSGEAALVLAQVFLPGGHAEYLNEAIRVFAVSVQLPAGRPGSEPGEPELGHRSQKGRLPLHRDREMNCDQHRSGIQSWFEGHAWVTPVGCGLRVDVAGLGQPPDKAGTDPGKDDDSRGEDGWPQPDPVGDESPK